MGHCLENVRRAKRVVEAPAVADDQATNSSELHVLLAVERGWSPDRYERWLADTWCRLLLPPAPAG